MASLESVASATSIKAQWLRRACAVANRKHDKFERNGSSVVRPMGFIAIALLIVAAQNVSADNRCNYCSDYINKLECVEHCLRLLDQTPRTARSFDLAKAKRVEAQLQLTLEQRKSVQRALNEALSREKPLATDGQFGPATRKRLQSWEFITLPGVKQGYRAATGYLDKYKLASLLQSAEVRQRHADRAFARAMKERNHTSRRQVANPSDKLSGLWSWRYDLGKNGVDVGYIDFKPNNHVVVYDYANDSSGQGGDCYKQMAFIKKPVSRSSYRYTHYNGKPMKSSSTYTFEIVGDSLLLTLNSDRSDLDGDGITDEKIVSVGKRASNVNPAGFKPC